MVRRFAVMPARLTERSAHLMAASLSAHGSGFGWGAFMSGAIGCAGHDPSPRSVSGPGTSAAVDRLPRRQSIG